MKRAQLSFKCGQPILGCLEEHHDLAGRLDFVFPVINGMNRRHEIGACRQLPRNQCFRDTIGCLHIRKSADGE